MRDTERTASQRFSSPRPSWSLVRLGVLLVILGTAAASEANWYPKCNQLAAYPGYCCWSGTAPVCTAGCPAGYGEVRRSKDADGALETCVVGSHKLCCPG
jgi:hypothetical protein